MRTKYPYGRRQLMTLALVSSLAPGIRLMPKYCAEKAGSASWLAPTLALPALILFVILLSGLMLRRQAGEGLGELILRSCGRAFGGFALIFAAAFMLFYGGFILISGAERFICTVYPAATPWPFVAVMLALGLIAASGPGEALVRSAKIFAPVIIVVIVTVLIFTVSDVDKNLILPVTQASLADMGTAALPTFEIFAGMLTYTAFFEGGTVKDSGRARAYILWLLPICLLFTALCLCAVGSYGAPLVARFQYPFFTMIRNVTLFRTIEHVEAVVVALWLLPDFVVFSMMLYTAARVLRLVFGFVPEEKVGKMTELKNGRWLILVCAAAVFAVALILGRDTSLLDLYSETVVPLYNLAAVFVLVPLCFVVGKIRERTFGR